MTSAHDIIEGVLVDVVPPDGLDDKDGVTRTACSLAASIDLALLESGHLDGDPNG